MGGVDGRGRVELFLFSEKYSGGSFLVYYLMALIQFKYTMRLTFRVEYTPSR